MKFGRVFEICKRADIKTCWLQYFTYLLRWSNNHRMNFVKQYRDVHWSQVVLTDKSPFSYRMHQTTKTKLNVVLFVMIVTVLGW